MPTEVHTICFHTRDAVERHDSRLVFQMPNNRVRDSAMKVALGSVEFPMVQWTVEEDWCRMYVNEGIRVESDSNELHLIARPPHSKDPECPTVLGIPARLNPIVSVSRSKGGLEFTCAHPHHLWSGACCLVPVLSAMGGGDVRILSCATGDVSLSTAHCDDSLEYVDEHKFRIFSSYILKAAPQQAWTNQPSFLYCPTIPSPKHLCDLLTLVARGCPWPVCRFQYDTGLDHVLVDVRAEEGTMFRLLPTPLARALGVCTVAQRLQEFEYRLPPGPTKLWDYVEIPTGFYSPCHRSMCVGQPMRFSTELEAAVNRFYFPLPQSGDTRLNASPSTPHALVFSDALSRIHLCPIPCGRYTANQLAQVLERRMSEVAGRGFSFAVSHEDNRFHFSCERKRPDGRVEPSPFSLLFHHPLCTESYRFGFPDQPIMGGCSYVAPERTHTPCTELRSPSSSTRYFGNLLRLSEMGPQKRFRFHAATPPPMTALICDYNDGMSVLRTHVNRLPYAHGLQTSDIVKMQGAPGEHVLLEQGETRGEWRERAYQGVSDDGHLRSGVVLGSPSDPHILFIRGPRMGSVGSCILVSTCNPEPWSMSFSSSLPKSIDGYMLGFPSKGVLWGIDGSVETISGSETDVPLLGSVSSVPSCRIPPFYAPNVHSLDHPDYVLITLNESSGANLEHNFNGESKHVFCKLSLYPLFREERMLPRDTMLSRSTFSQFELAFWNPDMRRPYKFHGAE